MSLWAKYQRRGKCNYIVYYIYYCFYFCYIYDINLIKDTELGIWGCFPYILGRNILKKPVLIAWL